MQELLQAHAGVECAVVHDDQQMTTLRPWAYYLVVLLFRGLFRDSGFVQILLSAYAPRDRSLELVTVMADANFDFPRVEGVELESYNRTCSTDSQTLPTTDRKQMVRVPLLEKVGFANAGEVLACALVRISPAQAIFGDILKVLALPFSPLASEGLQQQQVVEIAKRMHRYKENFRFHNGIHCHSLVSVENYSREPKPKWTRQATFMP